MPEALARSEAGDRAAPAETRFPPGLEHYLSRSLWHRLAVDSPRRGDLLNALARLPNIVGGGESLAEGEATSYLPTADGVLASGATVVGDYLIADALANDSSAVESEAAEPVAVGVAESASSSKTSVFDSPETVQLDSIVDSLAEDTASARGTEETDPLDQWFASL